MDDDVTTTSFAAVVCRRCGAESQGETGLTRDVASRLWRWLDEHYETCTGTFREAKP
jgi:hypothetical protein